MRPTLTTRPRRGSCRPSACFGPAEARGLRLAEVVLALCLGWTGGGHAGQLSAGFVPGRDLFSDDAVKEIRIEIPLMGLTQLRRDSRSYVPATLSEGSLTYARVGIHLKGSTGSFRGVDDKPALTLNFSRFQPGQTFHGLHKIHLNNSVEDPSYMCERVGSELFRAAGVPAPRVAWARVWLNGRPLGLYVLKEGFTEDFLRLYFTETSGNLYEGSGHDLDASLPRESGSEADERAGLVPVAEALREPDPAKRWSRLQQTLDIDRFVSFMATEILIGHRDGYCLARNNYRVYHDPSTRKLVFFPHGMDQLFGKADSPAQPHFLGLVAAAVADTPQGQQRYRERFELLLTNGFNTQRLAELTDRWARRIRPVLGLRERWVFDREVRALQERIRARREALSKDLWPVALQPLRLEHGSAWLTNWAALDSPVGGELTAGFAPDGQPALAIRAGPLTMASWRTRILLPAGRYRFEARVMIAGVEPPPFGRNRGAGLSIGGDTKLPPYNLVGDHPWTPLRAEFQVGPAGSECELICGLRAQRGEAWFDRSSLRVVRLGD
jgi:spore coat protein H